MLSGSRGERSEQEQLRLVLRAKASIRMFVVVGLGEGQVKEPYERPPDCVRWLRADPGDPGRVSVSHARDGCVCRSVHSQCTRVCVLKAGVYIVGAQGCALRAGCT